MVPPQFNSHLEFINPGLTLNGFTPVFFSGLTVDSPYFSHVNHWPQSPPGHHLTFVAPKTTSWNHHDHPAKCRYIYIIYIYIINISYIIYIYILNIYNIQWCLKFNLRNPHPFRNFTTSPAPNLQSARGSSGKYLNCTGKVRFGIFSFKPWRRSQHLVKVSP